MPLPEVKRAFDLSAQLLQYTNYYSMTLGFINLVSDLEGVEEVVCYEVFGKAPNFLIRRFPLHLGESFEDGNVDRLKMLLSNELTEQWSEHSGEAPWFVLDMTQNVNPRRVAIIKGRLQEEALSWIQGIYKVYSNLVALLDTKERDVLTHLLNRQSFSTILELVLSYYRNQENSSDDKASWIAILDIDHFKKVNDQYGHLCGDEVLLHFASLMEEVFSFTDFLFRYGGEEFVVIINQKDAKQVAAELERFRKAVESYQFPFGNITVSIGYRKVDLVTAPPQMMEQADKALYHIKENGRNGLASYHHLLEEEQKLDGEIDLF